MNFETLWRVKSNKNEIIKGVSKAGTDLSSFEFKQSAPVRRIRQLFCYPAYQYDKDDMDSDASLVVSI